MKYPLFAILCTAIAVSPAFADDKSGVKSVTENDDGSVEVKCNNGAKGVISNEETDRCVFSKKNNKNQCDSQSTWSLEEAATFLCEE